MSINDEETVALIAGGHNFGKKVFLADMVVLVGCACVERAAKNAGEDLKQEQFIMPGIQNSRSDQIKHVKN